MARYELTYLTRSEEDQAGIPDLLGQLEAKVENVVALGHRKLTYPIKKETAAAYFSFMLEIEPNKVAELNQKLLRNAQVLRHLIIADGIRKGEEPKRKLKEKDLEVPASVQAGFGEPTSSATAAKPTITTDQAIENILATSVVSTAPTSATQEQQGEELTAKERQKKLDEKLKQILGGD